MKESNNFAVSSICEKINEYEELCDDETEEDN
jgi:hypothetical protein